MRYFRALLLTAVALSQAAGAQDQPEAVWRELGAHSWHLKAQGQKSVTGILSTHYDGTTGERYALLCSPPDLPRQKVGSVVVTVNGSPVTPSKLVDQSPFHRPLFLVPLPAGSVDITVTYQAVLTDLVLAPGSPGQPVPDLPAEVRSALLKADDMCDHTDPGFRSWMSEHSLWRLGGETEIQFGYRVFRILQRLYTFRVDKQQVYKASVLCTQTSASCGHFGILFKSILCANRIPADVLSGRWTIGNFSDSHVQAEFWAQGVGWVGVDVTDAILFPDQTPRFFGRFEDDFLTVHTGTNFTLTLPGERTSRIIQWIHGVYEVNRDGVRISPEEKWQVVPVGVSAK